MRDSLLCLRTLSVELERTQPLENNIEIIDLPGFGLVWGSSSSFLYSSRSDLNIVLALLVSPDTNNDASPQLSVSQG